MERILPVRKALGGEPVVQGIVRLFGVDDGGLAVTNMPPAVEPRYLETIAENAAAETMLTTPPRKAEAAPWNPHNRPSVSTIASVTISCQRMTTRTGLFRIQGIC